MKEQCEAALLEENRKKNRQPKIHPSTRGTYFDQEFDLIVLISILNRDYFIYFMCFLAESSRPHLSHIENVENSDYINACYVDVSLSFIYEQK